MRRNYYDHTSPPGSPSDRAGEGGMEPYGAVPPQSSGGLAPRPEGEPSRSAPKSTPSPSRSGNVRRFALLLALILILTAAGLFLNGGLGGPSSPLDLPGALWDRLDPFYDWYGYGWYDEWYDYEEEDWLADLENTTVPRAPVGGGASLTLEPTGGAALTAQEIYARVAPSVVGVRAELEWGESLGTGVVMSSDGYIITNAHVIAGAYRVSVTLSDGGESAEALLVGYDGGTDLAVLKLDAGGLAAADFGDSDLVRVGDPVYAIGNPLGEELRGTMTDGIISAIDRAVDMDGQEMTLLQTTAALNSGNSGGALVNAAGQVVGITNMKMMSDWETIEGLGFAIPTSLAKEVVDELIATGAYAPRP